MGRRIARPLLVYSGVASLALAIALVTLASSALLRVSRLPGDGPGIATELRAEVVRRELRVLVASAIGGSALAALLIAFLSSRLVISPLRALEDELVPSGEAGEAEAPMAADDANEVERLARRFREVLRRLEAERAALEEKNRTLERLQQSLVRASTLASVGRLAAGVAHEVGNPLAAVLGYLRLLKLELSPEERQDALDRSARELDRIHRTIQRLLAVARAAPEGLELETVTLEPLAADVVDLARKHPALEGATLDLVPPSAALPPVRASAQAVRQIVLNLLINAGQALAGRDPRQIRVRMEVAEAGVAIVVEDDGPGVPAQHHDAIFDPFFTTKGDGTGLGLAVSRALAERMDGSLELQPSAIGGAAFVLTLPGLVMVER